MVLRLGRFFARSTTTTRVPIWGPSTVISENIPAVWLRGIFVLDAMVSIRLEGRRGWALFGVGWGEGRRPGRGDERRGGDCLLARLAFVWSRCRAEDEKVMRARDRRRQMGSEDSNEKENEKMVDQDPDQEKCEGRGRRKEGFVDEHGRGWTTDAARFRCRRGWPGSGRKACRALPGSNGGQGGMSTVQ